VYICFRDFTQKKTFILRYGGDITAAKSGTLNTDGGWVGKNGCGARVLCPVVVAWGGVWWPGGVCRILVGGGGGVCFCLVGLWVGGGGGVGAVAGGLRGGGGGCLGWLSLLGLFVWLVGGCVAMGCR